MMLQMKYEEETLIFGCLVRAWSRWQKNGSEPAGWDTKQQHNEPHFETEFVLTVSGTYRFEVQLSDTIGYHAHPANMPVQPVKVAAITGSPFQITVIPAHLDTANTRTLSYFHGVDPVNPGDTRDPANPEQTFNQPMMMTLQTRDRYDNVRCNDKANDTLTIGVSREDHGDYCLRSNASSESVPGTDAKGNTRCDNLITVKWYWSPAEQCRPHFDANGDRMRSIAAPKYRGGCYIIEFNSPIGIVRYPFKVSIYASTHDQNMDPQELRGKYLQDQSPWNITYRSDSSYNSSKAVSWFYFLGPGRVKDGTGDKRAVVPCALPLQHNDPCSVSVAASDAGIGGEDMFAQTFTTTIAGIENSNAHTNVYREGDLKMCRTDRFQDGQMQACRELQPVLTSPKKRNILKVVVTDQVAAASLGHGRGNLIDYTVDVTIDFKLDPPLINLARQARQAANHR
jgi:hypothetical protein